MVTNSYGNQLVGASGRQGVGAPAARAVGHAGALAARRKKKKPQKKSQSNFFCGRAAGGWPKKRIAEGEKTYRRRLKNENKYEKIEKCYAKFRVFFKPKFFFTEVV